MPNNIYSITCFSLLKNARCSSENDQLVALENALVAQRFSSWDALVAMMWNIHSSNFYEHLILKNITEYKNAVTQQY